MKLSEFKNALLELSEIKLELPNGTKVPNHFHITEAGLVTKHFLDCGNTERIEKVVSFQVWTAEDFAHRLQPAKLLRIIDTAARLFEDQDLEIEMEYQGDTIGKYGLEFEGDHFVLTVKTTNCLAQDQCGIPEVLAASKFSPLQKASACTPGSGCC